MDASAARRIDRGKMRAMIKGWGKCFHCSAPIGNNTSLCERCKLRSWAAQVVANRCNYASKIGAVNTLVVDEWFDKLELVQGCCFYCGRFVGTRKLYIEHKTPLSRGGDNSIDNVEPACASCNVRKRSKTADEYFAILKIAS
jgi:5-methylcytosine-specific restriction endonuclease McrA